MMPFENVTEAVLVGIGMHFNDFEFCELVPTEDEEDISPKPKLHVHEDLGYSMRRWLSQRPGEESWWQQSMYSMTARGPK